MSRARSRIGHAARLGRLVLIAATMGIAVGGMAGCASLKAPASLAQDGVAAQTYHGRFAVRYEQHGEPRNTYGNFAWEQAGETITVQLLDPLGQTQAIVHSAPRGASLELPGKAPLTGPRLEDVMHDALGFALPVAGLRYWLQMQPAPGSTAQMTRDPTSGRPASLRQDGWTIEYQAYFDADPVRVKRLNLTRTLGGTPLDVRLVIDE
ncbi:lipoprotein insertase outer membrane protein LolB [Pandoraea terrae]